MITYKFQNLDVSGAAWGTTADGVNDLGQVIGYYSIGPGGDPYPQAFIRTPGSSDRTVPVQAREVS